MKFQTYPFEKLNNLLESVSPEENLSLIDLTIGEPRFQTPLFIQEALQKSVHLLNKYPKTSGEKELKSAQRGFIRRRFGVELKIDELLPSFGTREVLFNFPQFYLSSKKNPKIAFVNPFYQIYEGAAIASRAEVVYLNLEEKGDFKPKLEKKVLQECDLVILNSPSNPTASVMSVDELREWVRLALQYDFMLLNDECYSEVYVGSPPPSLLEASLKEGNDTFKNILAVNSISKRSSAPGLRSGFIAGDSSVLQEYLKYRTYVGCAVPLPLQHAATLAWNDEVHVEKMRKAYKANFALAHEILGFKMPDATFYIYYPVGDGEKFAQELYKKKSIKVLPASFLGRNGVGKEYVRIALVHEPLITKEALMRIKDFLKGWD